MSSEEKPVEKLHILPMTIEEVEISDTPVSYALPVFIYKSGENVFYPGMVFDRAFIYVGAHRTERVVVGNIGGADFIFVNDMRLVPIRGTIYSVVSNGRHIAIAAKLREGGHAFIVLEEKNAIMELASFKTGLFSKKECGLSRIDIGMAGDRIYGVARSKTESGEQCPDILIYEKSPGKYGFKQYGRLIPTGWNGEWFTYAYFTDKNVEFHIIDYLGDERKYRVNRAEIHESYLIPGSIVSVDEDSLIMNNSYEIIRYDLAKREVKWRKTYENLVFTPRNISSLNRKIVAYAGNRAWVIDKETGNIDHKISFDSNITGAILDQDKLFVAVNNALYYYEITGRERRILGKYTVPGRINSLNILGTALLISYVSPGKISKIIYADYGEALRISLPVFRLTTGSKAEYEFREATPTIRVLKQIGPQILVTRQGSRMIILDRGSKPGTYRGVLQFEIMGYLPIFDEITVIVEKLETVFRKVKIQPRIVPSPMGPYIPVVLEPIVDLDEVYLIVHTEDKSLYGASHVLYNIPRKPTVIPVYVMWARAGRHNAELFINVWNRRNLFRERFSSKIIADYDIPTFYFRVAMDTARIWSPFNVEAARITFEAPGAEFTIIHDLHTGWNELDTHGVVPQKVRITLRSGITYVVERGASWIQLTSS